LGTGDWVAVVDSNFAGGIEQNRGSRIEQGSWGALDGVVATGVAPGGRRR